MWGRRVILTPLEHFHQDALGSKDIEKLELMLTCARPPPPPLAPAVPLGRFPAVTFRGVAAVSPRWLSRAR